MGNRNLIITNNNKTMNQYHSKHGKSSALLTLFLSRHPNPNGLESKLIFLVGMSCEGS